MKQLFIVFSLCLCLTSSAINPARLFKYLDDLAIGVMKTAKGVDRYAPIRRLTSWEDFSLIRKAKILGFKLSYQKQFVKAIDQYPNLKKVLRLGDRFPEKKLNPAELKQVLNGLNGQVVNFNKLETLAKKLNKGSGGANPFGDLFEDVVAEQIKKGRIKLPNGIKPQNVISAQYNSSNGLDLVAISSSGKPFIYEVKSGKVFFEYVTTCKARQMSPEWIHDGWKRSLNNPNFVVALKKAGINKKFLNKNIRLKEFTESVGTGLIKFKGPGSKSGETRKIVKDLNHLIEL